VGYVNVTVEGGAGGRFTAIANPLDNSAGNTLSTLFPNPPFLTNFYKWDGAGFQIATFAGAWDQDLELQPGEGGFINTDTTFTVTFVGEVLQGDLTNAFGSGFSMLSSQVPQAGGANDLGLTAALSSFDNAYEWNFAAQSYDVRTLIAPGTWDVEPQLEVGESLFVNAQAAGSWDRTFSVN
jgi:hypothetical protein